MSSLENSPQENLAVGNFSEKTKNISDKVGANHGSGPGNQVKNLQGFFLSKRTIKECLPPELLNLVEDPKYIGRQVAVSLIDDGIIADAADYDGAWKAAFEKVGTNYPFMVLRGGSKLDCAVDRKNADELFPDNEARIDMDLADLGYNAMIAWLQSGRPGLTDYIITELNLLSDITKPSEWRTALVLVGEHSDKKEMGNLKLRQSWTTSLKVIVDSDIGTSGHTVSDNRDLLSATRTLVGFADPAVIDSLLDLAANDTNTMNKEKLWPFRHTLIRAMQRNLDGSEKEPAVLSDEAAKKISSIVKQALNPAVFDGGDVSAAATAGIELLHFSGRAEFQVMISLAQQLGPEREWYLRKLKNRIGKDAES